MDEFTWPEQEKGQIRKAYDYRAGRRYQQIMRDVHGSELQRLKWLSDGLRRLLLNRFGNDPGFKKRSAVNKVNRASSKGAYLHIGGSATIPKTRARMTRSLDRPPTDPELFKETHTWKCDTSVVEKRADDLLFEFSANLEQATQQAQEEGDENAGTTLSEPYKNRVYEAGGFFASSLCKSGYEGSSASATSTHQGPGAPEHINEVRSLKDTLAEKDARAEDHLRCVEEMQRQMAAFCNPLRPESSTTPPLPPRPPPQHPDHDDDDDDGYKDA
ncbi:hypothetical protein PIB30_028913 [Stylosanthes scabra]|uniref:Uncharacterized protein n=1 Tax=Stylosanthes scabra TaxID=79078 RepID=A0ABU6QAM2_9FABA|nr:hypothetical protein [Stylosanthes scabra]